MKSIFKVVFAPFLWLVHGCSPLGEAFNEAVSENHYYNNSKTDVIYSPMGNWFELGKREMKVDLASFEVLNNLVGKDKNHAYFEADAIDQKDIDLASLHIRPGQYMTNIALDKNHVFWLETNYEQGNSIAVAHRIPLADPITFEQLDFDWAQDAENHFYKHNIVDVDYESFRKLHAYFSKDKDRVYYHYGDLFVPMEADASTFGILEGSDYALDETHMYYVVFERGSDDLPKLKSIPYNQNEELELLNAGYLRSGDKIYFRAKEVKDVHTASFEVVSARYAKDKNKVYFEHTPIVGADITTFRITKDGIGVEDNHGRYREDQLLVKD